MGGEILSINNVRTTTVLNPLHRGDSASTTKTSTNKFGIDPKNIKPPSSENSAKILDGPPTGSGSIAAFKSEVKSQKGLGVSATLSKMMTGSKPISKDDRSIFQTAKIEMLSSLAPVSALSSHSEVSYGKG